MAFIPKEWKARIGSGLNKFRIGSQTAPAQELFNAPDSITQEGDALSATNLNDLESRILTGFRTSITPDADNTRSLGSAARRYNSAHITDIYSGDIHITGYIENTDDNSQVPFVKSKVITSLSNILVRDSSNNSLNITVRYGYRIWQDGVKELWGTCITYEAGTAWSGQARRLNFPSGFVFSEYGYMALITTSYQNTNGQTGMNYTRSSYAQYKSTNYLLLRSSINGNTNHDYIDYPFAFYLIGV